MRAILDNLAIVLHKPRLPENIGASARAACNMGVRKLVVVEPLNFDPTKISKMATHSAAELVAQIEVFGDLEDALKPYQWVVGTTARSGSQRAIASDPRKLAQELIPITQQNQVALLFGPENFGLSNDNLRLCHTVTTIPTTKSASLNLAQAVMVLCYEIFLASRDDLTKFTPRLASHRELESMYDELKKVFVNICFINPENPDYWMTHVRRFFARTNLRARDISIIRGMCRQIEWYGSRDRDKN